MSPNAPQLIKSLLDRSTLSTIHPSQAHQEAYVLIQHVTGRFAGFGGGFHCVSIFCISKTFRSFGVKRLSQTRAQQGEQEKRQDSRAATAA